MVKSRFYPYVVVCLCGLFMVYKYILQVSPSVMAVELAEVFHTDNTGIGHITGSFLYSFLIVQLFAGCLLDRYSPRLLTVYALAVCAAGAYWFSISGSFLSVIGSRALMGVGAAFATVSYVKLASLWFNARQFAFVSGMLPATIAIGAVLGQAPLSIFVQHLGWRYSLNVCALLGLLLSVLFAMVVRDRSFVVSAVESSGTQSFLQDMWKIIQNKQNWLLAFYVGLAFVDIDALAGFWGVHFLQTSYSVTCEQAAYFNFLIFLGMGIGGPLLGWLSDRLGKRLLIMKVSAVVNLFSLLPIIYCSHLPFWMLGFLLFVLGFSTGAFILGFTVGKEINPLRLVGTVGSFLNTGSVLVSAVSIPLIGKLLDWVQGGENVGIQFSSLEHYRWALSLLPFGIIVALVLLCFVKEPAKAVTVGDL